MAGTSSLMASRPKLSFRPLHKEYASSINSTPPMASRILSRILIAVCPKYSPTTSLLVHSTICPLLSTPSSLYMRPIRRATVVLPVPALPLNTRCSDGELCAGSPRSFLSWLTRILAAICLTCSLTDVSPVRESSCSIRSARLSVSFC